MMQMIDVEDVDHGSSSEQAREVKVYREDETISVDSVKRALKLQREISLDEYMNKERAQRVR